MEQSPIPRLQNLPLKKNSTRFKSPLIKRNQPVKSQNVSQLRQEVVELENQLKEVNREIFELKRIVFTGGEFHSLPGRATPLQA